MPELFADRIRAARLVANPGCYPTSVILPAYPLIKDGLVEPDFISDSKSGVSGAGKKVSLEYIFVEVNEAVLPYKVGRHQHSPEMDQALSNATGRKVKVTFVPHLIPMDRGIVSTMYFRPARKLTPEDIEASYRKHYSTEPFVRLRGNGAFMRTKDVTGTNFIDIAWTLTDDYVIVTGVLDNLVKGAAGQAVECMNLMFAHDRTEGLLFA
jgi:N-acetyl-gamma-glutamyl-phosphate reductase